MKTLGLDDYGVTVVKHLLETRIFDLEHEFDYYEDEHNQNQWQYQSFLQREECLRKDLNKCKELLEKVVDVE